MSKEKLLGAKFAEKEIDIDGETYTIREMNAGDAAIYEASLFSMINGKQVYNTKHAKNRLILMTLYQNGARVFDEKDLGLIEQLPYTLADRIFDVAKDINNLGGTAKN